MVNPYSTLPAESFWASQISGATVPTINYEPNPKWRFELDKDKFATAGSCFAQHFSRHIRAKGGNYVEIEQRHPLVPPDAKHGYGMFSARYGNIYTCRQFRELVEQAFERRPTVLDFFQMESGRWIDLSRMRAIPDGFSSFEDCRLDRLYHLEKVAELFSEASVFIFTLGLTEAWINTDLDFCYPVCPGVIKGAFDPRKHQFKNLSFAECFDDLRNAFESIHKKNPKLRILLTVSPVMLVATFESRGALQSSVASKAILRAVADQCVRLFEYVDYFPSFEIVTGPQSAGRFYKFDHRDVSAEGVDAVMEIFFKNRVLSSSRTHAPPPPAHATAADSERIDAPNPFDAECDEILLGKR